MLVLVDEVVVVVMLNALVLELVVELVEVVVTLLPELYSKAPISGAFPYHSLHPEESGPGFKQ